MPAAQPELARASAGCSGHAFRFRSFDGKLALGLIDRPSYNRQPVCQQAAAISQGNRESVTCFAVNRDAYARRCDLFVYKEGMKSAKRRILQKTDVEHEWHLV
jgi:hypothetical protein